MSAFHRLHPGVQHHVVNSLGWADLRPLQEEAIVPVLEGEHALLLAPTAGGKTEAAILPVLSRMLSEDWKGLSVLYLCPLRALLNNLHVRLERFAGLVGRRVALWHADVGDRDRRSILADPPDILLTTPESLEVMLVARREHRHDLFGGARVAIVDELHAFASDDRGWHLLSVLERIGHLAGREIQRLGLSATIGNPSDLLEWLAGSSRGPRRVVAPESGSSTPTTVEIDYVSSLANASIVISKLHLGEKRLVFCDSRASVEEVAAGLRQLGVQTFVSHSSLSVDERRRAEDAFASAADCVIVATSTLELGIDVGDLDRVIQIDAPTRVAAFLQRLGRTGRRAGTVRNCLFLATDEATLLRACGLVELWREGYVEPVVPPLRPLAVVAQQILGLTTQEGQLTESECARWLGRVPWSSEGFADEALAVIEHMVREGYLARDSGILSFGPTSDRAFGGRKYRELFSVFDSEPLFTVFHGTVELGRVHESSFQVARGAEPVLLLAGRSWRVTRLDWSRAEAFVEPIREGGRSRWRGGSQPLHFRLCRAIRHVLVDSSSTQGYSRRALEKLAGIRQDLEWLDETGTTLVRDSSREATWWTFAGSLANAALAQALAEAGWTGASGSDLFVTIPDDLPGLPEAIEGLGESSRSWQSSVPIATSALDRTKFASCIPRDAALAAMAERLSDAAGVETVLGERLRVVTAFTGDDSRRPCPAPRLR